MPDTTSKRSVDLPEPTHKAISWRNRDVTPWMIHDLWKSASRAKRASRARILACRAMRRIEASSRVKVSRTWARANPEAAAVAGLTIEERITLDRNLIAAVGAVEPEYQREPQGFLDSDRDNANACKAHFNEWRLRCVPTPTFTGKQTEDGEHALSVLPCDLDMEGAPDYFEYIDEAAHADLPKDEQQQYSQDEGDARGRYVKQDARGNKQPRDRYASILKPPAGQKDTEEAKQKRHDDAQKAHQDDVTAYILRKQLDASTVRVIPALDCAPVFRRGKRRDRWELVALVERTLYEPWDLLDAAEEYRWVGCGDRKLIPQGYRDDGSMYAIPAAEVGVNGQVYVYTAYLPVVVVEQGKRTTHILICTTIGGAGTWDATSGREDDPSSVSVIDLYEEYGVEGEAGGLWPFISYHGGLRTEDDDPDHYWQPYIWALLDRLKAIESMTGAIRATVGKVAFTGHFYQPDSRFAATPDGMEALLDSGGNLRKPRIPGPGEIEEAPGSITPVPQAVVGQDAKWLLEHDRQALKEATAIDQIPTGDGQTSGRALLVQATLGQVAKRHIREGVQGAVVAAGEAHFRTLDAIYKKWGIRWPIRTTQEKPVKTGQPVEGKAPSLYDPEWAKDGQYNLDCSWPAEENLARVDQEMSLAMNGYASFDDVQRARGEDKPDNVRLEIDRDRLLRLPAADALRMQRVSKRIGDADLEQIANLQAQQTMAPDTPGVPGGVPAAALNRGAQQRAQGMGSPSSGASARGGIIGAQQTGDAMQHDAQAAIGGGIAA